MNGDGYADIIVGAPSYDNGEAGEGAAFVYHGSTSGISVTAASMLESNQADAEMGLSVSGAGDINGDGYADVIVSANGYSNDAAYEGAAFVYHGNASAPTLTYPTESGYNNTDWIDPDSGDTTTNFTFKIRTLDPWEIEMTLFRSDLPRLGKKCQC